MEGKCGAVPCPLAATIQETLETRIRDPKAQRLAYRLDQVERADRDGLLDAYEDILDCLKSGEWYA